MNVTNAAPGHVPAIVALCEEMERHYGTHAADPYESRLRRAVRRAADRDNKPARRFYARLGDHPLPRSCTTARTCAR